MTISAIQKREERERRGKTAIKKEVFKLAKNCRRILQERAKKAQIDRESTEQSDLYLPEEIIEEILPRIPWKSLFKFRCVSKSWCSLIKTHLQNSTKNTSLTHHCVIFSSFGSVVLLGSLHSLLNEPSLLPSPINEPTMNIPLLPERHYNGMGGRVVDSCNGLVCIIKHGSFFLWNPTTRISVRLPEIVGFQNIPNSLCGFGWDEASGAYKVFTLAMSNDGHRNMLGKIYNSKTNSWTTVDVDVFGRLFYVCDGYGQFVCGKIHWLNRHDIDSFDLKGEVFGVIKHPGMGSQLWLGEIKGCLSLVCDDKDRTLLDVWVMKEYGVKESWLKLLTVPLTFPHIRRGFLALFEINAEGVILLIHGSSLLVYSRDDTNVLWSHIKFNTCYEMWESKEATPFVTHFYVESLVSPLHEMNL